MLKQELATVLQKWDLLKHPFYQAWSMGSLPVSALQLYAAEYGAFVDSLASGWTALGDPDTALEEVEHAGLWTDFRSAIGSRAATAVLAETGRLLQTAEALFSRRPTALGAMYAFEAQQPATATSKLRGLETHYAFPKKAREYFAVHAANSGEAERLLAQMTELPPGEKAEALAACATMSAALWDALTGIHTASRVD